MKRAREGYTEDAETRRAKVFAFIRSLRFSRPLAALFEPVERAACPSCGRRRLRYCYDCLTVVHPATHPPPLALPLGVTVVLHPGELRAKSTSLAAATISPDIHIVPYPEVPAGLDPAATLVLYPSERSVRLADVEHLERYTNVVFVDSTWQQSKAIARDDRITRFTHVRLCSQTSLFWRFQNNDPSHLATVEAIYYFLREYTAHRNRAAATIAEAKASSGSSTGHTNTNNGDGGNDRGAAAGEGEREEADLIRRYYHGEVDDLLYYYIGQYIEIQQRYAAADASYTDRHFDGYVLKGARWEELLEAQPSPSSPPPQQQQEEEGERKAEREEEEKETTTTTTTTSRTNA